ncbi:MAG: right-handed parallel beta-helix repeat-containing protein [Oscillospiraceae bacterium]|nr:right-handed parallel beta-helix repeat-containing protein [Oscillospiraceae bacterium]
MTKKHISALIALMLTIAASATAAVGAIAGMQPTQGILRTVIVTTAAELDAAIVNALAGDEIIVKSGTYDVTALPTKWNQRAAQLRATDRAGTSANPIVLRSEDPAAPARIVNKTVDTGITLHIWGGDYWIIQDLEIEGGQKGILFDNTTNSIIRGNHVFGCGQEAIHLRDGSSDNIIINNRVTDTGLTNAGYGEGIYVGNANSTTTYNHYCNNNTIAHNVLGPGIAADCVDIKEGSSGTIVEYNIMYGAGIAGQNSATSHILNRGDETIIRYNTFYRDENPIVRAAVENWAVALDGRNWGQKTQVYGNTFYLDDESTWFPANPSHPVFAVGIWSGTVLVGENTIIDPVTSRNLQQIHAFSGATITTMPTGTYPPPEREAGLLTDVDIDDTDTEDETENNTDDTDTNSKPATRVTRATITAPCNDCGNDTVWQVTRLIYIETDDVLIERRATAKWVGCTISNCKGFMIAFSDESSP